MSSLVVSTFLRRVFAFDAVATLATGGLLAAGAPALEGLMGLSPEVSIPAGLFLIAYAAVPGIMAARKTLRTAAVWTVIAINGVWVVESLMSLALGWVSVNPLGTAFVVAQAAAVGVIALLQVAGLRGSERFA